MRVMMPKRIIPPMKSPRTVVWSEPSSWRYSALKETEVIWFVPWICDRGLSRYLMMRRGTKMLSGLLGSIWSLSVIEEAYLITVDSPP